MKYKRNKGGCTPLKVAKPEHKSIPEGGSQSMVLN